MNSTIATIGCPSTRRARECTIRSNISRGPKLPSVRARIARIARVSGAPKTSSSGTSTISIMCCTMWVLKCNRP